MTETEFQEKRRLGIGGSDFDDLLELSEYGCRRRLFYQKTGLPPDYTRPTWALKRGHRLEPVARAYLQEKLGLRVVEGGSYEFGICRVNVDGYVSPGEMQPSSHVVELKTVGEATFSRIKKHGAQKSWIMQLNWGMGLSGIHKGYLGVYHPDSDGFLHFEVEFDQELFEKQKRDAQEFWEWHVETGVAPIPLFGDTIDDRCYQCVYRKTCKGLNSKGLHALDRF